MIRLAFFAAAPRSGKTTAADMAEKYFRQFGLSVERLTFARALRAMIAPLLEAFDATEFVADPANKEKPIPGIGQSYRSLLVSLGTAWGRERVNEELWVNILERQLAKSTADVVLIDDLRFENERQRLQSHGFKTVWVDRGLRSDNVCEGRIHPVTAWWVLANKGSLGGYKQRVFEMCDLAARTTVTDKPRIRHMCDVINTKPDKSDGTLYLAGPMRGIEDFNHPAFFCAEKWLQALGWKVINPARLDANKRPPEVIDDEDCRAYASRDLGLVINRLKAENGDAIAVLPGWENSTGAIAEVMTGLWCGVKIICAETGKRLMNVEWDCLLVKLHKSLGLGDVDVEVEEK